MNKDKEEKDLYEKVIKSFKNNPFIVFCMVLFLLYISISKIIETTAKNVESISKISNSENVENTENNFPKEEPPTENVYKEPKNKKYEPKPLEKNAIVEIRNYHLIKRDMFLVDEVSGTKKKIESSNINFPIPTNQSTVKFKIKDVNGKSFGTANSDCCDNNLNITYYE